MSEAKPTYSLPKFRKGVTVKLIATGKKTFIESIHHDAHYGHFYKLKDVVGVFAEHELQKL